MESDIREDSNAKARRKLVEQVEKEYDDRRASEAADPGQAAEKKSKSEKTKGEGPERHPI